MDTNSGRFATMNNSTNNKAPVHWVAEELFHQDIDNNYESCGGYYNERQDENQEYTENYHNFEGENPAAEIEENENFQDVPETEPNP